MGIFGTLKPALGLECGNCGKAGLVGARTCPRCGVVFEPVIAKCSHCASWIPADAAQCAKCNTTFEVFRNQWQMRSRDRKIMLPKAPSIKDAPKQVQQRATAVPRIVEDAGGGPPPG